MTADTRAQAARLRAALADIRRDWPRTLQPARHGTDTHARSTATNPPLPVPANVLDARTQTHETLTYWTMVVTRGRRLHRTGPAGVPALAAFLTIHAAWLGAYPRALIEIERAAAKLTEIAAQNAPKRFVVAKCPVVDCAGLLRVTLRRDDALLPSEIRCTLESEHKWAPNQWAYMARIVKQ